MRHTGNCIGGSNPSLSATHSSCLSRIKGLVLNLANLALTFATGCSHFDLRNRRTCQSFTVRSLSVPRDFPKCFVTGDAHDLVRAASATLSRLVTGSPHPSGGNSVAIDPLDALARRDGTLRR